MFFCRQLTAFTEVHRGASFEAATCASLEKSATVPKLVLLTTFFEFIPKFPKPCICDLHCMFYRFVTISYFNSKDLWDLDFSVHSGKCLASSLCGSTS